MKPALSTSLMLALFFTLTSLAQRRDPVIVKSKATIDVLDRQTIYKIGDIIRSQPARK
jgi:hypothetical protein